MEKEPNINNEIEEIEQDEEESSLAADIEKLKQQDASVESGSEEDGEDESDDGVDSSEPEKKEETEEEKELRIKQEAYKKRQEERRKKAEELAKPSLQKSNEDKKQEEYAKRAEAALSDADRQAIEYFKQLQNRTVIEQNIKAAESELVALEAEFKEAFPDYEDKVNQALEITKVRLIESGMSETEADKYLKREKVLLADAAAAAGKDPVEAVYNEAKSILNVFEKYAEKAGYIKPEKKKTNLQALREASKPNAMSGGAGRGAAAAKKTMDDMQLEELDDISIGQMLSGQY